MKKISLLIMLFIAVAVTKVSAQTDLFSLQYSVGFGMGDMKDFIGTTSWRGATMDYRHLLENGVGVGFSLGWNAFYEDPGYTTVTDGTISLSGDQWRYCSTVPVLISLDYYFKPEERLNPFAGLGVGTMYSRSDVDMGIYEFRTETWHFAIQPEIGVIFQPTTEMGIIFAAKYYNAFKTEEQPETRSYLATNIGIVWKY